MNHEQPRRRAAWTLLMTLALGVTLSGCAGGPHHTAPPPGPLDEATIAAARARTPDTSADELRAGRTYFVQRCNGCHAHPDIGAEPVAEWPKIIAEFGPQAKLDAAGQRAVLRFVLAVHPANAK